MFVALLILLYVMSANAIIVPTGCFVLVWSLVVLQVFCAIVNYIQKCIGGDKE